MFVPWHMAHMKFLVNQGSLSDIILFGSPKNRNKWRRYKLAMPSPLIFFIHGRNLATLELPWSTMVSMALYFPDLRRSVIRSIDMY